MDIVDVHVIISHPAFRQRIRCFLLILALTEDNATELMRLIQDSDDMVSWQCSYLCIGLVSSDLISNHVVVCSIHVLYHLGLVGKFLVQFLNSSFR